MKRVFIIAIASISMLWLSPKAMAQGFGGAILDHDIMMPADIASLSQTQPFGTARVMGMGGAFTSLGADMSSVAINPAGLGMYIHDEFSFTPMLTLSSFPTAGQEVWRKDHKTSFGLANIGATFNMVENGKGALISLTGAFTYNRTSDYNSRISFSNFNEFNEATGAIVPNMTDVFKVQLAAAGIEPDPEDGHMSFDNNPYFWPAQLAYKGYMLDMYDDGSWGTGTIGYNSSVLGSYDVLSRGRAAEYSFALGGNISNILYFGATFNINEIANRTEYAYQEEYLYNNKGGYAYYDSVDESKGVPMDFQAQYAHLWQNTSLSGSGVGMKLGLVARPTRGLRIGVAFHTPVLYSLIRTYQAGIETTILGNYDDLEPSETFKSSSDVFLDSYENRWQYSTPPVLLTGISYQLGRAGVISFDYERKWYNGIRVQNTPYGIELSKQQYKDTYKENYKPTNTFRLGLEVKPLNVLSLRAGAGYTTSMIGDSALFYSSPVATDSRYYSLGVGMQFSRVTSLDIAWQHHDQSYNSYRLFYVEDAPDPEFNVESPLFTSTLKRNYISATLSFKF